MLFYFRIRRGVWRPDAESKIKGNLIDVYHFLDILKVNDDVRSRGNINTFRISFADWAGLETTLRELKEEILAYPSPSM